MSDAPNTPLPAPAMTSSASTRRASAPALAALGALALLAGCTTTPTDRQHDLLMQSVPAEAFAARRAAAAPVYRLQVGDVIDLRFRRAAELNETVTLRPDGRIAMPWVGEVQAAGLTPQELATELQRSYASVLLEPQVDVLVRSFQPARLYVGGEVGRPGEVRTQAPISLAQAIVQQGDFTPDAERRSVIVVRQRGAAEPEYIRVDFASARVTRLAEAAQQPCSPAAPLACPGAEPMRPEAFMLEPLDLVIVPKTQIAGVAQFFERYVAQILPVWRNFGVSAIYSLRRDTVVIPDSR